MLNLSPTRLLAFSTLLFATVATQAQMHHVEAPEKVTRSIGVYEWTGDLAKPTAARLIPVSVFIEGLFQDGGTYYSRPIPLALLNGNIYSLEKAGVPQGTLTLDYARHLQTATSTSSDMTDIGWFGYGTYATMPAPRKAKPLHSSATLSAIVSSKDDDRPTFIRRNTDSTTSATTPDSKTAGKTASTASANDDPDKPHFSKPPATTPTDSTSSTTKPATKTDDSSTTTTTKDPADDNDRPTLRHRDPKQATTDRKARDRSSVSGMSTSLNDDPDRPNMRRGKTAGIGGDPAPQLTGVPAGLHQIVAVSDPVDREPHPFAREWATPTERAEILAKLQAIAQQQLVEYAHLNGLDQPAKPKLATRTHRVTTHIVPAPVAAPLTSEELTGYTLSYGGLPTFVYTAISKPPLVGSNPAQPERYVTIAAQQLPGGEVQRALATVTDAAHLDRNPWFRLVDAVDPDAEHRASLLFELRGQTSREFALYRILSARAEPIFITSPTN